MLLSEILTVVQHTADSFRKLMLGEGFHKEFFDPYFQYTFWWDGLTVSGAEDDRNIRSDLEKLSGELEPRQTSHSLIGDDKSPNVGTI